MEPNSFFLPARFYREYGMMVDFPRHQFGETPEGGVLDQMSSNGAAAAAGRD